MERSKTFDWVETLKIGDEVTIERIPFGKEEKSKVKNITKKHKIRLENGQLFDMWGELNSSNGYFRISPVEKENV